MEIQTSKSLPIGLILMAGKSSRMGVDKAFLINNNLLQWQYLKNIMMPFCKEVLFNTNKNQVLLNEKCIVDDQNLGPMGGMILADRFCPGNDWLVIACDLPFLTILDIQTLFHHRSKIGTAYQVDEFVEPLVAIYENEAVLNIKKDFELGQFSLKKSIEKLDFKLIKGVKSHLKNCNFLDQWP